MSLRRKERAASQSQSDSNDDEAGECASTALLKRPTHMPELRKSSSTLSIAKRRGRKKGTQLLRPFSSVAVSHGQTD